jgi:peroxiredoxin
MKKVLLSIIGSFAVFTFAAAQTDTTTITRVGDKAPVFICVTIDGKTIDISKLQGKIIMINFFATWCGPCNLELPVLQKNIWDKYKNKDNFQLIILGRQHNESEVSNFVKSKKFTMPFAPDPERKIYGLYATQFIPRNVIIGKDGRIIFQSMGYTPEEFKKIEDLLAVELK